MKRFQILATILILANFCKSAWSQRLETESTEVVLTEFSWTHKKGGEITDLRICADTKSFTDEDGYIYSLTYLTDDDGTEESNYEDGVPSDDARCVSFNTTKGHAFSDSGVTYSLTVTDTSGNPVFHGAAHFAVYTKTLSMDCSSPFPLYYRIEAAESAVFKEDCLPLLDAGGNICYRDATDEDISTMDICYFDGNSMPVNVKICQTGLEVLDEDKLEPGDPLQIDYLAYGREGSGNATLKLTLEADMTEVIVVAGPEGANEPAMCSYDNGLCTIDDFKPQNIEYSVCGLATTADLQFTSVGRIQDFKVFLYSNINLMFNFGFVNAHVDRLYSASLLDKPEGGTSLKGPVNINCAKIKSAHNCYGFMILKELQTEEIYLEVSFLNTTEGEPPYNTVIVPYGDVAPTTTTTKEEVMPPPIK